MHQNSIEISLNASMGKRIGRLKCWFETWFYKLVGRLKIIKKYKPTIVFTPSHDLNKDHQIVFESTLVVTRPFKSSVKQIFSYEIPGSSKSPFSPNYFENISKEYSFKIKAFKKYKSEIESFPHPRSFEFLESLSKMRGVESGLSRAEAFQIIKFISN